MQIGYWLFTKKEPGLRYVHPRRVWKQERQQNNEREGCERNKHVLWWQWKTEEQQNHVGAEHLVCVELFLSERSLVWSEWLPDTATALSIYAADVVLLSHTRVLHRSWWCLFMTEAAELSLITQACGGTYPVSSAPALKVNSCIGSEDRATVWSDLFFISRACGDKLYCCYCSLIFLQTVCVADMNYTMWSLITEL